MEPKHWARKEESLEEHFSDEEARHALMEQMKRTNEWREHEEFHRRKGEEASIVLHEENVLTNEMPKEMLNEKASFEQNDSLPHRPVLTGWCQCQSPSVRLVLGEDGEIKNDLGTPPATTNSYGVAAEETTAYGTTAPTVNYGPSQAAPTDLYKKG